MGFRDTVQPALWLGSVSQLCLSQEHHVGVLLLHKMLKLISHCGEPHYIPTQDFEAIKGTAWAGMGWLGRQMGPVS